MIFQEIKKLLTPNSLCLEYKCILMKTFIWKFPFYHGLCKLTLGKTKKETGKDISFDCFQQYADEERPTPLHLEMEWWLGVTTKYKLVLKRLMRTVKKIDLEDHIHN